MNKQSELQIDKEGTKWWYLNGILHRTDGPAIEFVSEYKYTYWYLNGLLHREDGPAVENAVGLKEYWLNHVFLTQEEWFKQLTPEQQYNYLWNLNDCF
jgi:hypothetical protein